MALRATRGPETKMPPADPEAAKICVLKSETPRPCSVSRGVVFYEGACIPIRTILSREISNYFCFSLNSPVFRSIVPQFPSQFHLARPPPRLGPRKSEEDTCRII